MVCTDQNLASRKPGKENHIQVQRVGFRANAIIGIIGTPPKKASLILGNPNPYSMPVSIPLSNSIYT